MNNRLPFAGFASAVLLGLTVLGLLPAKPVDAAAVAVLFEPRPGSTLTSAPVSVRVYVSDRPDAMRSFIRVTDQAGNVVNRGLFRVERTGSTPPGWIGAVDVDARTTGLYTVDWQITTAWDDATTRNRFQFRVELAGQAAPSFRSTLPAGFGLPRPPRAARFPSVENYHAERNLTNAERAILARNLPAAHRQLTFAIDAALEADDTELLAQAYLLRAWVRASLGNTGRYAGAEQDAYEAAVRGSYEAFFLQYPAEPEGDDEEEGDEGIQGDLA